MTDTLPAWYTQMQQEAAAAPTAADAPNAPRPDWLKQMDADEAATAPPAPPAAPADYGAAKNLITGLARIPGAIVGGPALLGHGVDYLAAKVGNAVHGTNLSTDQYIDKYDPTQKFAEQGAQMVEDAPFKLTGTTPYEPTSPGGKVGQAVVTGAGAALLDPLGDIKTGAGLISNLAQRVPQMLKTGLASGAANVTQQAFPNTPALAAATALATHTGLGAAVRGAKAGAEATGPVFTPTASGERQAGRAMRGVDNTQPGMALPSAQDLKSAGLDVRNASDDIGTGLNDYEAGDQLRSGLQGRHDALIAQRGTAANDAYGVFRSQPPMPGHEIAPFMSSPAFRSAVKEASAGRLNRGQAPLTDYFHFDPADGGEPTIIPNAAVPPDVLDRIKGALDDQVNGASGNVARGDVADLRKRFVASVDARYPQTYGPTRSDFAAASRPLDPLEQGPSGRTLDNHTAFGNRTYTVPPERVTDLFLKGATRSNMENLIAAHGGDRTAAMGTLEQNLAGKVQDSMNADGTINLDHFNKTVKPYAKAINVWFPQTAQKFATAEAAQKTLDTLKTQDGLGQSIRQQELRNGDGVVTKESAGKWLASNEKDLEKTQSKGAVMRLKQLANGLPSNPTGAAEAVVEGAPAAIGFGLGGSESGIFGAMFHALPKALVGPSFDKFKAAYSSSIERAFSDPTYAAALTRKAGGRPAGMSFRQAIANAAMEDLKNGARGTPAATIASGATR